MTSHQVSQARSLAALLPPLLVEAERVASTVQQGIHGRRRAGMGESFWQFRRYEAGEPAERIDWRQSARTDKLFIREREWEAAQNVTLWADSSGSMQFASLKNLPTKAARAQLLMLALASLVLRAGEHVTWLDRRHIAVHGLHGLERIAARLGDVLGESMPPDTPITRHSHVLLCSDFLMEPDQLTQLMRRYAAQHLRGALIHILDPAEREFAFEGRLTLQGLEGETSLLLPNAGALREAYHARLAEHRAHLRSLAESAGWFYISHTTSELPHLPLMEIYQRLAADRGAP